MRNIPAGSVAPNTEEKLLSDTNAFDGGAAAPLKPTKRFDQFRRIFPPRNRIDLPFPIHILLPAGAGAAAPWAGPNMSANGLPNWSKSSDAFVFVV